ncbi:uncharacterized protein LOC143575621 [Bidens hawaiensis]|uniref:uncharacterized protein LOC143575621 n=1 Tax=Bidens hawaiensis TaxID=980011 RepID=UPI00404B50C3
MKPRYEALIDGIQLSKDLEIKNIHVFVDSLLLASHFNCSYAVRIEKLTECLQIVKNLAEKFDSFIIEQVHREENAEVDALANLGSSFRIMTEINIPIIHILNPATIMPSPNEKKLIREVIERYPQVNEVNDSEGVADQDPQDSQESWVQPIKKYLQHNEISKDENPIAFCMMVSKFIILNEILYKKSLAGQYLRRMEDLEIQEVLKDIHEGDCGNHTGA